MTTTTVRETVSFSVLDLALLHVNQAVSWMRRHKGVDEATRMAAIELAGAEASWVLPYLRDHKDAATPAAIKNCEVVLEAFRPQTLPL